MHFSRTGSWLAMAVLTPSSLDFATATWSWSREKFARAPPVSRLSGPEDIANAQATSTLGKFDSFAWHDGPSTTGVTVDGATRTGLVQLWRPPGQAVP